MIPTTQREALSVLAELCEMSDDVRFGQLLAHLGFLGECDTGRGLWDIDDDEFLAILSRHKAELMARRPDLQQQMPPSDQSVLPVSQSGASSEATPTAEHPR